VFLVLALAGSAYLLLAGEATRRFLRAKQAPVIRRQGPPVTLLKPLHGDEPQLEAALSSFLGQDYPGEVQMVLGVHDPFDPAAAVAERVRARHPDREVILVIAARRAGANGKVSNLIHMASHARHEVIVVSDSDIEAPPGYLASLVAALEAPGVGLVTCPYHGVGRAGFWSRLAAMDLTYRFLPSLSVGLALGLAKPSMGSSLALRRGTLARIGGFEGLADTLADDYALGAGCEGLGLETRTAPVLVAHGCAEKSLAEVVAHELRWARTIRGIDPAGFAGSALTHPVAWALLGAVLTQASPVSLAVLAFTAACRLWMMRRVEGCAPPVPGAALLFPLRDVLSLAVFMASFFVGVVDWRGERFRLDDRGGMAGS